MGQLRWPINNEAIDSRIVVAVDEHRVEICVQILIEHGGRDLCENFKFFTLNPRETAAVLSRSSTCSSPITMRHFWLIKLREINAFNTNFHRENSRDFPSFLVLFSVMRGRHSGVKRWRRHRTWRKFRRKPSHTMQNQILSVAQLKVILSEKCPQSLLRLDWHLEKPKPFNFTSGRISKKYF